MRPLKRIALLLALSLTAFGTGSAAASARFLHTITRAQAYGVANRFGQAAYERTDWAEGWWRECKRQTPWTFSCTIEVWSEAGNEPACWREFDVASSVWNGRLRTEDWTSWACNPEPAEGPPTE